MTFERASRSKLGIDSNASVSASGQSRFLHHSNQSQARDFEKFRQLGQEERKLTPREAISSSAVREAMGKGVPEWACNKEELDRKFQKMFNPSEADRHQDSSPATTVTIPSQKMTMEKSGGGNYMNYTRARGH
jgi:hypothetical protein